MNLEQLKLGALPPKYKADLLHFEEYVPETSLLPPLPEEENHHKNLSQLTVMGNLDWGDCVAAAGGHVTQILTATAANEVLPPDQTIIDIYLSITKGVDSGLYLIEFLDWWCKNPIPGIRKDTGQMWTTAPIAGFASINPLNFKMLKYGILLGGAIFYAFMLPKSAKTQLDNGQAWQVPPGGPVGDGRPNSWGGHGICSGRFDRDVIKTVTWGVEQDTYPDFFAAYCPECYVVFTVDWFDKLHRTPNLGLNWSQLHRDMTLVSH